MSERKKLIEVALPLEAINRESAREKSIRHGHPSTMHLWWARRPLAACRAVLFASLVDDPSSHPDRFPTEEEQDAERTRLFGIIEELVKWENTTNERVLNAARAEILKATDGNPPPVLDPFCGGGSIPLEAQRLGLEAHGSDLNPVAVLITKALIEIPPKFAGWPPVSRNGESLGGQAAWKGAAGLAEDVRYYGKWMRDEANQRIGHLFPQVGLPEEQGGSAATVIAWLWARTVTCPNPACGAQMPLVRSFALSTKKDRQAWATPVVNQHQKSVHFAVRSGTIDTNAKTQIQNGTALINERGAKVKATFRCCICETGVAGGRYIDDEANAGRLKAMPYAVVAEGRGGRLYVPFGPDQQAALESASSMRHTAAVEQLIPGEASRGTFASNAQGRVYGFRTFGDYFTDRQLVVLTCFVNLLAEAREKILADSGGDAEYAAAVTTLLAFAVDRLVESCCSLARWQSTGDFVAGAFARQSLSMMWDFAEVNPFSSSTRNFSDAVEWVAESIERVPAGVPGFASQADAVAATLAPFPALISTDPPYYDNIGYADLSDFFYVWLRRSIGDVWPNLFTTLLTPKANELIASPYRHDGSRTNADTFFENGLGKAFARLRDQAHPEYPLTIYYAFKQAEGDEDGNNIASTGWDTMLEALIMSGLAINGTWPMRTERSGRTISLETNALASSVVLVCRPRPGDARMIPQSNFVAELRRELPEALRLLQHGTDSPIAPVDLAQAAIGPGMAIYSKYSSVLTASGERMPVRRALELINQILDEVLREEHGDLDADTRWAITWFSEYGLRDGDFDPAATLSRAFNTSVEGMVEAGIVESRRGKVRLLKREELDGRWDAAGDARLPAWEVTQRFVYTLQMQGEGGTADVWRQVGDERADLARDLAYRLYSICERKGWAQEALGYNALVTSWPEIARLASDMRAEPVQASFAAGTERA